MDSAKKLTISNKSQIRLLVEKMEQNPEIARGQRPFGQTKQSNDDFWEQLSNELNSEGPPVRKRQDWQRVWTNYKQNLRRKMSNNRQNVQATGGGPSEKVPLTMLETTVADLLNTRAAVCPAGQTFGVSIENKPDEENAPPPTSPTPTSPTPLPPPSQRSRTQVGKREKIYAIQEQTKNQLQIIKKLEAIKKCCHQNHQTNKQILKIKKQKLLLLKNKEEDEAKIRKLDIKLKQKKLLNAQARHF